MDDKVQDQWTRAAERAAAEGLTAERIDAELFMVKDYFVVVNGPRWSDMFCTCLGGQHHGICKHQACTIIARRAETSLMNG